MKIPLVVSNRIGKETAETEHGKSTITFFGNSFIAVYLAIYVFILGIRIRAIRTSL